MKFRTIRTLPALAGLVLGLLFDPGPIVAQSVAGPVLGYVLDRTAGALRPIRGIPGAATMGDPIELDASLADVSISPEQDYALAADSNGGDLVLIDLTGGAVARRFAGAFVRPQRVAISPGGGTAALVDLDERRVQILSGLPNAPSATRDLSLDPGLTDIEALAVSDDGTSLLVATRGAVYVAREQGFERLIEARVPRAISYFRNSHDALIADFEANHVVLVRDITGAAETSTLASQRNGIVRPVAVQPSADGRRVFVANSRTARISVIDLETGDVTHLACSAVPAGLFPLRGGSVFRLNELAGTPLFVLDGGAERARIVFVPPPVE